MSTNSNDTAGFPSRLLSKAARAIDAALLIDSSVTDCVTVTDSESQIPLRIYIVGAGARPERLIRPEITAILAGFSSSIDFAIIAVSNIPLTDDGYVDTGLLSSVPVIDDETVGSCEHFLRMNYPDSRISVDISTRSNPESLVHCTDLGIQHFQPVNAADPANLEKVQDPVTVCAASNQDSRLAISRNAPLADPKQAETLPEALIRAASCFTTRGVGYIEPDGQWLFESYARLYDDAQTILAALQNQAFIPGQMVLLQLSRNADFIPAFWACILGGIIPVPVTNPPTYSDLSSNRLRNLVDIGALLNNPAILTSGTNDRHISRLFEKLELTGPRTLTIESLRESGHNYNAELHAAAPDDLAMLLFTSGSTGHPKGIRYTQRNIIENVASSAAMNAVSDADVTLNWLHLDHVGALVRCCLRDIYVGNTQIHAATQLFLHDPLQWLEWIESHRVTFAWAPNFGLSLFNERLRDCMPDSRDLSFVRSILSVAEPIVPKVALEFAANMQRFEIGPEKIHAAWGMSETSAAVVFSHDFLDRLPSKKYPFSEVGRPVPGLSIRVVDDHGQILKEGAAGNVEVAGAMVVSGYFANEQATESAYGSDGWLRTGDLGFLKDGRLTITGRKNDTIIINGRNITSQEIESVVENISGVEKTCTAAIAIRENDSDTDQLALFFHTEKEQASDKKLLLERIVERVVSEIGIRPSYVIAVDRESIPRSSAGKILRSRLRDRFLGGDFDSQIRICDLLLENERTLPGWFLKRKWRQKRLRHGSPFPVRPGTTIIFQDSLGLAEALQSRLESRGLNCFLVRPGSTFSELEPGAFTISPGVEEHYKRLVEMICRDHQDVCSILHLWAYTPHQEQITPDTLDDALDLSFLSLAYLAKALHEKMNLVEPLPIHVCATDSQPVFNEDYLCCEKGTALGLIQTIPQELPLLDFRHYDFSDQGVQETADLMLNELVSTSRDREVAYRNGSRFAPVLEELTIPDFSRNDESSLDIQPGGLYLITGGFGEIGLEIAKRLIEDRGARLLLVGRTDLPDHITTGSSTDVKISGNTRFSKALHGYQALKSSNPFIEYRALDICDDRALLDAVEDLETAWKSRLCGVFHLARVTDDRLVADQTRDGLLNTLKPKVQGTLAVGRLLDARPDAFFIGFSSVTGTLGTYRMAAYASANRFIDNFCVQLRYSKRRPARSLAWSIWEEVGAERSYQMRDLSLKRGLFTLSTDKGIASMFAAMRCHDTGVIIGLDPGNRYIKQFMAGPPAAVNDIYASISFATTPPSSVRADKITIQDSLGHGIVCQLSDAESLRHDLPGYTARFSSSPEHVQQRTELEKTITEIWEKLLRVDCVEPQDNFFDLGGHSILAAQFVAELAREIKEHIELSILFDNPILGDLANALIVRQADKGWITRRQEPLLTKINDLLDRNYRELRIALQQQFPQILEKYPVENYVQQIRELPAMAGYVQIGTTGRRTINAIRERAGDTIESLYNRLAIVHSMQLSLSAFDQQGYPKDIEELFVEWFHDILVGPDWSEENYFRLDHDAFLKDMAVCTGRMIPVGGAWIVELSGISRRIFFSGSPSRILARCLFMLNQVHGFTPFYQIHMALRFADCFNEVERKSSYLRIAALLDANREVKGLIGSSWYLDPALKQLSPELSYLQELPENNGALIFPLTTTGQPIRGALAGSAKRKQLYKEGKYNPRNAFIIWPRAALLGWADGQDVPRS